MYGILVNSDAIFLIFFSFVETSESKYNPASVDMTHTKFVKNPESFEEYTKHEESSQHLLNMGIIYYFYCEESTKPFPHFLKTSFLHCQYYCVNSLAKLAEI